MWCRKALPDLSITSWHPSNPIRALQYVQFSHRVLLASFHSAALVPRMILRLNEANFLNIIHFIATGKKVGYNMVNSCVRPAPISQLSSGAAPKGSLNTSNIVDWFLIFITVLTRMEGEGAKKINIFWRLCGDSSEFLYFWQGSRRTTRGPEDKLIYSPDKPNDGSIRAQVSLK